MWQGKSPFSPRKTAFTQNLATNLWDSMFRSSGRWGLTDDDTAKLLYQFCSERVVMLY